MECKDIGFGTYECAYNIMPPFKIGFDHVFKTIPIDKCILKEVVDLWEKGIRTTGCCCGHGRQKAFIGVAFEDIDRMKALGYKVQHNPCRPNDEDTFDSKTVFTYGKIDKGFDWWIENKEVE